MIRFLLFFSLLLAGTGLAAPSTNEADRRYLAEFTKQQRDINKVRENHMIRVFPLLGLSAQKGQAVFAFSRRQGGVESFEDLLAVPGITREDIGILRRYFFIAERIPVSATNIPSLSPFSAEEALESVLDEESGTEDDPLRQDLEGISDDRMDLNSASAEDLSRLPWLTPFNIFNILNRRRDNPFQKIEDLLTVPGLDAETIRQIQPFVIIRPFSSSSVREQVETARRKKKPLSGDASFRAVSALPLPKEHFTKTLHPSAAGFKSVLRLTLYEQFKTGIALEQDRGEPDFYDLFKYYVAVERIGFLKKALWGNFRVTAGQGLTVSDRGPSRSVNPSSVRLGRTTALKEDLSSYENRWFFGPAILLEKDRFEGFLFSSFLPQDGTILNPGTPEAVISSFSPDTDGLHDTAPSLEKKHAFIRQSFGARTAWNFRVPAPLHKFKAGLTAFHTRFPLPVIPAERPDNIFAFRGRSLSLFDVDWDLVLSRVAFFGEASLSMRPDPIGYIPSTVTSNLVTGGALYTGFLFQSGPWKTSLAFRRYENLWVHFDAMPLSEYSGGSGETGLFCAQEVRAGKNTKIFAFADVFSSSWRRYNEKVPPFGSELTVGAEHRFSDRALLSGHMKAERKLVRWSTGSSNTMTVADYDRRIRTELRLPATPEITTRFRIEYSRTVLPELRKEYDSILAFADAAWILPSGTSLRCRLIGFDTVYEAGIWEYENDIPAYMSSPSLLGRGGRFYVLLSRNVVPKNLSIHLKTAVTRYFRRTEEAEIRTGEESLSSSEAAERTAGSVRYEIRCQIVSRF